jgi:hypothetical protein
MVKELTKVEQKQVAHAIRSDVVFRHLFERIEATEEKIREMVEELARDKTLSEKLKSWLKKK